MKYTLSLSVALLFSACSTTPPVETTVKINNTPEISSKNILLNENNNDINNYEGSYHFVKGTDSLKGIYENIDDGYLVIEKLDEDDYGFYYVEQSNKYSPNSKFGIFHYENNRFYQKFLDGSENRDNVKLVQFDNKLETTINTVRGTQAIQWKKTFEVTPMLSEKLMTALKNAKENYRQIYKEKFID